MRKETKPVKANTKKKKSAEDKKTNRIYMIIIILLLLLLIGGGLFLSLHNSKPSVDMGATIGTVENKSPEEIEAELNEKVDASMINISMNAIPEFQTGSSEGNLQIVNREINNYPQIVEIYLDSTDELIYKSGLIPVGSRIDNAKLDKVLDAGEYECTAYFNAIDEASGTVIGKAGAEIKITILNDVENV